jgi:5'-nucleotidase
VSWTLITNDDGVAAPGLHALARAAVAAGHRVVVAAPAEQASGAGTSIIGTQVDGHTPVTRHEVAGLADVPVYGMAAQPAFIAFAAVNGWFPEPPSLVLSGINEGANLGRAVMHSGTVGAALTAGRFGIRALAVSLAWEPNLNTDVPRWDAATTLLPEVLGLLAETAEGTVLSLNVPNVEPDGLAPLVPATLSRRGLLHARVDLVDGAGEPGGADGDGRNSAVRVRLVETGGELEPDSDAALLATGHPTLTALRSVAEAASVPLADLLATRALR